ncbi:hypothetical protein Tco_1558758, partial [Tanacetum coccineum]
ESFTTVGLLLLLKVNAVRQNLPLLVQVNAVEGDFINTLIQVAFLEKPDESEGFEQIVDFLNAHTIKYALTLQALVDGKKIVITESTIRRDLHLEDAKDTECLPTATIFEELTRMGLQGKKIQDNDADEDITLENVNNVDMFGVHDLDGEEVFVENMDASAGEKVVESEVIAAKDVNLSVDEVTLAQALATLKNARPTKTPTKTTVATTVTPASTRSRDKGIVFHDQEQAPTPTPISSSSQPSQIKDKGKGIMVEDPLQM